MRTAVRSDPSESSFRSGTSSASKSEEHFLKPCGKRRNATMLKLQYVTALTDTTTIMKRSSQREILTSVPQHFISVLSTSWSRTNVYSGFITSSVSFSVLHRVCLIGRFSGDLAAPCPCFSRQSSRATSFTDITHLHDFLQEPSHHA